MLKDIDFGEAKNVSMAIVKEENGGFIDWKVAIVNENSYPIKNVLVTSRGYGKIEDEKVNTSTLRHFIGDIEPKSLRQVETLKEELFKLTNEFWVSFYVNDKILDKKYIFLPESIVEENLRSIPYSEFPGIFHL